MTRIELPVRPNLRNEAQGPHFLGPAGDGGFYARLRDVPTGVTVEYVPQVLSLVFQYDGAEDQEPDLEDCYAFNPQVAGLTLRLRYSRGHRRPHSAQFIGFDAKHARSEQLVQALHAVLDALSSANPPDGGATLRPQDILSIKAVGTMCASLMDRIIEDLRTNLRRDDPKIANRAMQALTSIQEWRSYR